MGLTYICYHYAAKSSAKDFFPMVLPESRIGEKTQPKLLAQLMVSLLIFLGCLKVDCYVQSVTPVKGHIHGNFHGVAWNNTKLPDKRDNSS